jgi:hypothetical protein
MVISHKEQDNRKFQEAMADLLFSTLGYETIDRVKLSHYSLKELEDSVTNCIKNKLVDRSTQGMMKYFDYVLFGLFSSDVCKIRDIIILEKVNSFNDWINIQIDLLKQGGAIDYAELLSNDPNNSKESSFLDIIKELEEELNLQKDSLLPLIHLFKNQIVQIHHPIVLWKLFVIIDVACSRGYFINNDYLACTDRKSKDKLVRDLLCQRVTNKNGQMTKGKNISDSIRQSLTKKLNYDKESPNFKGDTSNFKEFSIKTETIFDKWTFRKK